MNQFWAAILSKPENIPTVTATDQSVQSVAQLMFGLAAGLSVVFILLSAIRFSISSGDTQKIATARRSIIYSVTGLVISMSAYIITAFIQGRARAVANTATNPLFGQDGIITTLINTMSYAVGVISVIMLIIGAMRYVTSAGVAASAQAARNTILYAIIGILTAFSAQLIVGYVLAKL
jgi:hypothetical protein